MASATSALVPAAAGLVTPHYRKDMLHVIVTHANCFDGGACTVVLEQFCKYLSLAYKVVPHSLWRAFKDELAAVLVPDVPVRLLLFDVAPDDALVDTVLRLPNLSMVVGDHHEGNRRSITRLVERASAADSARARLQVMYDTNVAGVQLAWRWIIQQLNCGGADVCRLLGIPADTEDGMCNRMLNVIAAADINAHKGIPEMDHADAAIRMLYGPDVHSLRFLICTRGAYDSLIMPSTVSPGALCARIRGLQSRDMLARGRTYFLVPTVLELLNKAGAGLESPCSVFYVQGTPHLTVEMAERHVTSDMVWIWSKNERADNKYVVSIRLGKPSAIRCDIVASTLTGNGNGHVYASGMAFDHEPIDIFVTAPPP